MLVFNECVVLSYFESSVYKGKKQPKHNFFVMNREISLSFMHTYL